MTDIAVTSRLHISSFPIKMDANESALVCIRECAFNPFAKLLKKYEKHRVDTYILVVVPLALMFRIKCALIIHNDRFPLQMLYIDTNLPNIDHPIILYKDNSEKYKFRRYRFFIEEYIDLYSSETLSD